MISTNQAVMPSQASVERAASAVVDRDGETAAPTSQRIASRLASKVHPVAYHGALSAIDQVVVSGTNFLASIIVGRACGPEELGDYTLGFTIYCVAIAVQGALISLPFTIYRHQFDGDEQRAYSGSTLAHFASFALLVSLALGLAGGVLALGYGPAALLPLVSILAVTFPLALLVEFARRFAFARFEMITVLGLDAAMSTIRIGLLGLLAYLGVLSATGAYVAMGLGALVAGVAWLVSARSKFLVRSDRFVADAKRNWRCGRWVLVRDLTLAARSTSLLWLVALMLDAASTGIFVACDTLVRLSSPLMIAVANVLFPKAALAFAEGGAAQVRRLARNAAIILGIATAPFCIVLILWSGPVLSTTYGAAYLGQGTILSLMALTIIPDVLDTAAANGLLAIERPNVNFVSILLGTVTMLTMSAALIPNSGLLGAVQGLLAGRCVTSGLQWVAFLRLSNAEPTGGAL